MTEQNQKICDIVYISDYLNQKRKKENLKENFKSFFIKSQTIFTLLFIITSGGTFYVLSIYSFIKNRSIATNYAMYGLIIELILLIILLTTSYVFYIIIKQKAKSNLLKT